MFLRYFLISISLISNFAFAQRWEALSNEQLVAEIRRAESRLESFMRSYPQACDAESDWQEKISQMKKVLYARFPPKSPEEKELRELYRKLIRLEDLADDEGQYDKGKFLVRLAYYEYKMIRAKVEKLQDTVGDMENFQYFEDLASQETL